MLNGNGYELVRNVTVPDGNVMGSLGNVTKRLGIVKDWLGIVTERVQSELHPTRNHTSYKQKHGNYLAGDVRQLDLNVSFEL